MEQPFLELDNGRIHLRLASDGSRLEHHSGQSNTTDWKLRICTDG